MKIINEEELKNDYIYEFTVVAKIDDSEDEYEFIGHFENGWDAESAALSNGGIVLHNVKVTHKIRKENYYVK